MICLFERYDQASFDLLRSLKTAGLDCPVVVIRDDGYLAPDVESPYSYFTGDVASEDDLPLILTLFRNLICGKFARAMLMVKS